MDAPSLLPAVWNVPESFRKRLGRTVGRQRVMVADDHLLLVLHAPPGPEDMERTGRFFWRQPDGTWNSSTQGGGPAALAQHLDEYQQNVEALERADDEAKGSQQYFDVIYRLDPVQRAARHLHEVLQKARVKCPDDRELINLRDRAYQIERTAELLARDARNAMELQLARQTEQQAASNYQMALSAHRLNVLAAFFFPIITLCTIFSTNLQHGLEEVAGPWPLVGVLAAGLVLGIFLRGAVSSPKKPGSDRQRG